MWLNHDKAWFLYFCSYKCVNSISVCVVRRLCIQRRLWAFLIKILPPESWLNLGKISRFTSSPASLICVCSLWSDFIKSIKIFLITEITGCQLPKSSLILWNFFQALPLWEVENVSAWKLSFQPDFEGTQSFLMFWSLVGNHHVLWMQTILETRRYTWKFVHTW